VPDIIEIIDAAEKIDFFIKKILPYFELIPKGGLISVENATFVANKS
jgi:PII-like signaling protein